MNQDRPAPNNVDMHGLDMYGANSICGMFRAVEINKSFR